MGLAVKYERGDGSVTISMWGQQPAAGRYCCTKRLVAMTVARAARHGAVKTQRKCQAAGTGFLPRGFTAGGVLVIFRT